MALQHIIICGLKDGHLLHYDEKLNEERNLYKKVKTIFLKILSSLLSSILCFFFNPFFCGFYVLLDHDYGQVDTIIHFFLLNNVRTFKQVLLISNFYVATSSS
jgi:hypothetical protein